MSERTKKFSKELDRLIEEGGQLLNAIQRRWHKKEFDAQLKQAFNGDKEKIDAFIEKLPDFQAEYQKWYSESQAVIKQVLPDRLSDFRSHYEYNKTRKSITFENYMIRDYLQGLQVSKFGDVLVDGSAAIPEVVQQLNIVRAARSVLGSILMDLRSIVQADLFESEIEAAIALAKAGFLRPAGAICGVIIEKHLKYILESRNVKISKKNPSISDLSQLLRASEIITLPQERFIQSLADIRNICTHAKEREPKSEEINDIIEGTKKVIKTIF
jgi:hypothetical protein